MKLKRETLRRIAYAAMAMIAYVLIWVSVPGDTGDKETSLVMVIMGTLGTVITTIIGCETYSNHSARINKTED